MSDSLFWLLHTLVKSLAKSLYISGQFRELPNKMGSVDEVLRLPDKQALVQVASSLAGTRGCQLDNDSYPSLDQVTSSS